MENRGGLGEENEQGVEARDPLLRLELLVVMPNENMPVVDDEVDTAEGVVSDDLRKIPPFEPFLLSALSDSCSFVTDLVTPEAMLHVGKGEELMKVNNIRQQKVMQSLT